MTLAPYASWPLLRFPWRRAGMGAGPAAVLITTLLAACGQTGDLYLPPPEQPEPPGSTAAPDPATPPEPVAPVSSGAGLQDIDAITAPETSEDIPALDPLGN
ncbi:LPS translocon maturation chaperone LptM [Rhabdochromatium marinum]|uniref:LPS translocon maturation chaperone LptM n=1 Tax=Rhabdochromatium marinum TaxID=48729 RepID=UPI001904807B|nr:lipoprotein [Rhabdochromatium marinum]